MVFSMTNSLRKIIALVLLVASVVLMFNARPRFLSIAPLGSRANAVPLAAEADSEFIASHPLTRPIDTVSELLQRVQTDPALARFYLDQGFNVNCISRTILAADTWIFSSWRKGSVFGLSKTPQLLLAGEIIFTSCGQPNVWIRGKCGNIIIAREKEGLISPVPLELPIEAPPTFLAEVPTLPTIYPPGESLPFNTPINNAVPIVASVPSAGSSFCCIAGLGTNSKPPVSVPEPGTWMLTASGILFALYFCKRRKS